MAVEVLYEIGVEEIPAGVVLPALEQLEEGLRRGLADLRLSHGELRVWGTPRRLAVLISEAQERQEDAELEVKGPPAGQAFDEEGQPTPAASGFARSRGLGVEDLQVRPTDRGDFVFATVREPGRTLAEVLPELLREVTLSLTFPKTMRWGEGDLRFARPLRWLVALAGEEVLELEIAGVRAGRTSRGHRTLGQKEVVISAPGAYLEALRGAGVIADHREREALIREQAQAAAAEVGGRAVLEDRVVTEVNFLVECPTCLLGSFPAEYLALPEPVITTVMQGHQKYFPVRGEEGRLAPHFVVVSNVGPEAREAVRAGNERVLVPRLEDAKFYWDEDMRRPLADRRADLERVVFMGGLGTLRDKTERLVGLVDWLAEQLSLGAAEREAAERAAGLSKCDLVTMMIGDSKLGELQGVVGGYYAAAGGEPEAVAQALGEHYRPVGAEDALPDTAAGALLSLADKLDNLAAAFRMGLEPTGSADPQGLRRQAVGVLRLLRERGWSLDFGAAVKQALAKLPEPPPGCKAQEPARAAERLQAFCAARLEGLWLEEGIPYDVARAVLAVPWRDVVEISQRARFLADLRAGDGDRFAALATVAERPARIRRPQEVPVTAPVDSGRFAHELEGQVWALAEEIGAAVEQALGAEPADYQAAVRALLRLAEPIHELFEEVMIMAEEEELRQNRLALMARIDGLFLRLADFLQVVQAG